MYRILFVSLFLLTTYQNKTYTTQCAVDVNAPAEISDSIFNRFIHDFQTNPDALFDWAFYGVGAQNDDDEKNSILLEYKETKYIPEDNYGKIVSDVVVPHFTKFKDIILEGYVLDESQPLQYNATIQADSVTINNVPENWLRHFFIKATKFPILIKQGFGDLYIIPVDATHSIYYIDFNVQYGWFFNIFVTKRVYKNSLEWRINNYIQNLKKVAEDIYKQ